ncbi:hypothetical protein F5X97DRAFT_308398 [Nemania serpens]|nr:hypothetical protein F5X97DRAFT_308398 [Nemania serpens]
MDITCCDSQKAVIGKLVSTETGEKTLTPFIPARNILLFSLIIDNDDDDDQNDKALWAIYYHMYLDKTALDLLRSQAKKLYTLSATMGDWQQSKYGSLLCFCDSAALVDVRKIWKFYSVEHEGDGLLRFKNYFESTLDKIKAKRSSLAPDAKFLTGIRSAFPFHRPEIYDHLSDIHRHYWNCGSIEFNAGTEAAADHPNPTLVMEPGTMIHYGTDPLLGFHFAPAYVALRPNDPISDQIKDLPQLEKIAAVARIEFRQWVSAFRKYATDIRIRFFTGDAISFAHTLQNKRATGLNTAHWYRNRQGLQPLILDGPDYATPVAPLDFDVIDTSNLFDHVGSLTLLTALSPLLRSHTSSVLFTEVLARHNRTHREVLDDILCGHVPTVSTLLDLFPVEYWTNTSSTSQGDEGVLNSVLGEDSLQLFLRTSWKRPPHTTPLARPFMIKFDEDGLAKVLYQVYDYMFREERLASPETAGKPLAVGYHRGSFASFLRLVKARVICNWDATMNNLMALIESRLDTPRNMYYFQELCAYLHMMGVFSSEFLMQGHKYDNEGSSTSASIRLAPTSSHTMPMNEEHGDLRDWKNIPSVVCVTLKVQRDKLDVLTSLERSQIRAPAVHCVIESPEFPESNSWQHLFSACQLGFGDITTRGKRHSDSFEVSALEDDAGWNGNSSLIVLFHVPAFFLLPESRVARLFVGIFATSGTAGEISRIASSFYVTTVENSAAVYITRYGPNQAQFPVATGFTQTVPAEPTDNTGANSSLKAGVNPETGRITTFTARLDITSDDRKLALKDRCRVQRSTVSPCEVAIHVGNTTPLALSFPVFVVEANQTLRISRKSASYIEVAAQVAGPFEWMKYPHYMYPIHLDQGRPINWNTTYLDLQACPIIDRHQRGKLDWLSAHIHYMRSAREEGLREKKAVPQHAGEKLRLYFKESLLSLFARFAGLIGDTQHVFSLWTPQDDRIVILVSSLRINLADRAVVLDCAIIPLHTGVPSGFRELLMRSVGKIARIGVSDEELQLWRRVLPTYVERCRTWTHRPGCEYKANNSVPLATQNDRPFLCACGNGGFPPNFINIPNWDAIAQFAVRAAISPAFWAPFVDELYQPSNSGDSTAGGAGQGTPGGG